MTPAVARRIGLSFRGATERWSMGSALFEIGDAYFFRLGTREPDTVQLYIGSFEARDMMIAAEPDRFFITDHFKRQGRAWSLERSRCQDLPRPVEAAPAHHQNEEEAAKEMTRVLQPSGPRTRGSLKWIQKAINKHPSVLDAALLPVPKTKTHRMAIAA